MQSKYVLSSIELFYIFGPAHWKYLNPKEPCLWISDCGSYYNYTVLALAI